jgi:GT2 family glycosyltransferase
MKASIIIPVWNGADVIADCLATLRQNAGASLLEVICVDNASTDESAKIIQDQHEWVNLIRQPVNLGFAGGINAGVQASRGEVIVLLNQDCLVMPSWLDELIGALDTHPKVGVLGSTVYHADGTINHTGAEIQSPEATGIHLTDLPTEKVRLADFVTGAAIAIRRTAWDEIGPLDEGYYPAYFEDADYCYRARRKGYEVACATFAQVRHLFSSREWQSDYYWHAVYTNTSRYRFVCKHFQPDEFGNFFQAEKAAIEATCYLNEVIGRLIAARHTLRFFDNVMESRQRDLVDQLPNATCRQLQVGFSQIIRQAFQTANQLLKIPEIVNTSAKGNDIRLAEASFMEQLYKTAQAVETLKQRELALASSLYFRPIVDTAPEGALQRLYRVVFKRLPSLIIGRDERIMREIYQIRSKQVNEIEQQIIPTGQCANLLELLSYYDDYYQ